MPPDITHILETPLYCKDVNASAAFYRDIMGFKSEQVVLADYLITFQLGNGAFLLFQLGKSSVDVHPNKSRPELTIPKHGPTAGILKQLQDSSSGEKLQQHYCFAVPRREDVIEWEKHFAKHGVNITGVMDWERGGRSVYFEDPDGHIGEVVSRGIWPFY